MTTMMMILVLLLMISRQQQRRRRQLVLVLELGSFTSTTTSKSHYTSHIQLGMRCGVLLRKQNVRVVNLYSAELH